MPGPAETLSRWAPNMTTWSAGPPGQSAIRLLDGYVQEVQLCSVTVKPAACSLPLMYASDWVYPALPARRLPPFCEAIVFSWVRCACTSATLMFGGSVPGGVPPTLSA